MAEHKKIFVVSDIHGCCSLLKEALSNVGFNKDDSSHLLICCGDYFDRGSENFEVLKFFERLPHKVLLRGNHEDLLLKLLQTGVMPPHNYINGSQQTITEFFGKYAINPTDSTVDFSGKTRMIDRLCEFIDETLNFYETEHYVFVHGWLPEGKAEQYADASDSAWEAARWVKWSQKYKGKNPLPHKTLVCGHMPTNLVQSPYVPKQEKPDIFYGNALIAIDAGTFDSRQINVLVLEDELI